MTSTMKLAPAMLGALALSLTGLPSAAVAQPPSAFKSARTYVTAPPRPNATTIVQQGDGNAAGMLQQGQANSGVIQQYGRNHSATLEQYGDNNAGCIVQIGKGESAAMVQSGQNLSYGVLQGRGRTMEIPVEACDGTTMRRDDFRKKIMGRP